jgi:hypothetical protein
MVKIAIHSVFIAKENILFLEEWIDYHTQLGVEAFYLYDNSKVQRVNSFNAHKKWIIPGKVNKYNINFDELVKLSEDDIRNILLKIESKYKHVNIIEWSPKDSTGKICHFQEKAHADCLAKLKNTDIDWCASIDMDEFIVLNSISLKEYISKLDPSTYSCVLSQKRYDSRFNNIGIPVVNINKVEKQHLAFNNAHKYIYNVKNTSKVDVHSCNGNGKVIHTKLNTIWFNHYKIDFNNPDNEYNVIKSNMDPVIVNSIVNNYKQYITNIIDGNEGTSGNEGTCGNEGKESS